jgi:flagellar basal body P-ring protein FlgI
MIDELTDVLHPKNGTREDSEQNLEYIAVAGASAIQRLISERNELRVRVNAQQGDLVGLNAANVELRRCLISIRQHYIELATKVLSQLEQFDYATRDITQERQTRSFERKDEDANLVSLARRLKPVGTKPTSVGNFDE